jgi:uncharacterized membrane protein YfcA
LDTRCSSSTSSATSSAACCGPATSTARKAGARCWSPSSPVTAGAASLLFLGWAKTRKTSGVSAAFILLNSIAALAETTFAVSALPPAVPLSLLVAAAGALLGTQLGTRLLPIAALRYALSLVLVIAGSKLILA